MRGAAVLIAALLALAVGCGGERRPNVLLIVMDTARGDRCSVNGYELPTTPELGEFARGGITYENAWSPSGWTGPAHASLFTGLRPENHGLHRGNRHFLLPESSTLAERFRDAGYRTAAFSNNDTVCPENGIGQGFERFETLYLDQEREYPYAPETHRKALRWVKKDPDRPFFLFINHMEPHFSYIPPDEDADRFLPMGLEAEVVEAARSMPATRLFEHNARAKIIPQGRIRLLSSLYDAEIAALDREIGVLIGELEVAGLLDDTVVVVTSDHGESFGEHGVVDHMFGAHRALRHVPLVIRYPPMFLPGQRVEDVVRLEDLAPTLLAVCGLKVPRGLDGESLLGDLKGRVSRGLVDAPRGLLDRWKREYPGALNVEPLRADVRAVFDGRYHLLSYSNGREELYDVREDPRERRDIAAARGDVTGRLRVLLPPW